MAEDSVDVLMPLAEQKGRHFAEKFGREERSTFWYQDETHIVSRLGQLTNQDSSLIRTPH